MQSLHPFADTDPINGMLSLFFRHLCGDILIFVKRTKVVHGGTEALLDYNDSSGRGLNLMGVPSIIGTIQLAEADMKNMLVVCRENCFTGAPTGCSEELCRC